VGASIEGVTVPCAYINLVSYQHSTDYPGLRLTEPRQTAGIRNLTCAANHADSFTVSDEASSQRTYKERIRGLYVHKSIAYAVDGHGLDYQVFIPARRAEGRE
jgi:hypothetical protein